MALADRMLRAARLDPSLYEEVEADPQAMGQAVTVVVISSIAAGIGSLRAGVTGLFWGAVFALVTWYIWSLLTYWIGAKLLPEPETRADAGQLLRTVGFANSPGVIRALGIIPGLGRLAFTVGNIWMLVAVVIAVRHALDYRSSGRAAVVVVLSVLVPAVILWLWLTSAVVPGQF